MQNPLINPESPHYQLVDGVQSIDVMEKIFTVKECMIWAKMNAMKYALRVGRKNIHGDLDDAILSDVYKRISYEKYYMYLKEKLDER